VDAAGVDHTQPLFKQVLGMKPSLYDRWVHTQPMKGSPRIFVSDWFEKLTFCPWWYVPLWAIPCAAYLIASGAKAAGLTVGQAAALTVAGLPCWHLIEYVIHRFVFHMKPSDWSSWFNAGHFLAHGVHHKYPYDPSRLVFPPVLALLTVPVVAWLVQLVITGPLGVDPASATVIVGGGVLGYLSYDMMHYATHFASLPPWLQAWRKYHMMHHGQGNDNSRFGITTTFFDILFGTYPKAS